MVSIAPNLNAFEDHFMFPMLCDNYPFFWVDPFARSNVD